MNFKHGKPTMAKTTKVIGYFNANPWPVHLSISAIGISVFLANRGEFVVDEEGNKINDPILESYVGPGQLSREISAEPVPVRFFSRRAVEVKDNDYSSVMEAAEFVETPKGVKPVVKPKEITAQFPENYTPITAMSMEQAIKLKLVRPMVQPKENAPTMVEAKNKYIPSIDEATPRDMTPRELEEFLRTGKYPEPKSKAKVAAKPAQNTVQEQLAVQPEAEIEAVAPEAEPEPQHEQAEAWAEPQDMTAPQETPPEAEAEPAEPAEETTPEVDSDDPAQKASRMLDVSKIVSDLLSQKSQKSGLKPEKALVESLPGVPKEAELPKPDLGNKVIPPTKKKFICLVDGKVFNSKAELEQYAKRRYPGRAQEIMAPYQAK
jgi:hypothetical protein